MATTTNYSWTTPDDTALVKDGAAAIRSLGTAIDTTVFNNASAAIAKTIVDAKGDIIAATAADTVARLAVGTNGQILKANSATATGLEWGAAGAAGANYTLVNSGGTALSGSQTITISGISGKEKIMILCNAASFGAGDFCKIRINGDSGANYLASGATVQGSASYASSIVNRYNTVGETAFIAALNNSSGYASFSCFIDGGTGTGSKAAVILGSGDANGGSGHKGFYLNGIYAGSAAITSISITNDIGNFTAGTVYVYASA